jgi:hypothetical protein
VAVRVAWKVTDSGKLRVTSSFVTPGGGEVKAEVTVNRLRLRTNARINFRMDAPM